jgi:hypothetical protein
VTEPYQLTDEPDDAQDDAEIESLIDRAEQSAADTVPPDTGTEAARRDTWQEGDPIEPYMVPEGARRVAPADIQTIIKVPRDDQEVENRALIVSNLDPDGRVRFRLEFRVRLMDERGCATGRYLALKGDSFTVDCRTEEAVDYLRQAIRKFMQSLDGVMVEREEGGQVA